MSDPVGHRQGLFGLLSPGGPLGSSDKHGHSSSWTPAPALLLGNPVFAAGTSGSEREF